MDHIGDCTKSVPFPSLLGPNPDMDTETANPSPLPDPLGLTAAAFAAEFRRTGLGTLDAGMRAYESLYRRGDESALIGAGLASSLPVIRRTLTTESPEGEVVKFLLGVPRAATGRAMPDELETESVIIPMQRRHERTFTLCVSSQVGCAMGCTFCETAQMGLIRSLSAREIVAQWLAAAWVIRADIKNIVFMGMGEPLDNVDGVVQAIEVLTDHRGPSIAMSRITVSTVGRLDGLARLRECVQRPGWKQLNLAVSINAPNDEIRSRIMPVNRSMPLDALLRSLRDWPLRKNGAICAEYVLIPGVNNAPEHAAELCARLKGLRCCVNVIPYNPRRDSPWPAPSEEAVSAFLANLESHGQFCKRRRTKGRDTMAACGQLGNEQIRRRQFVPVGTNVIIPGR